MEPKLALLGGEPAVTAAHPHEPWPPPAAQEELDRLARQRVDDINIRGNAGPIGELEEAFREELAPESRYAVAFNSGTSALLAAYVGVGVGPGDEVVGPELTYHAALSPAFVLGARVRTADIERGSRCLDPASVEAAVTERTRAVVVVHQWGHPADVDGLLRVCDKYDLPLIEDCSHAHGTTYKGRAVGTFGTAGAFSLQTNKAVFAGEGGILVTSDPLVKDRAILLGHYRDRAKSDVEDESLRRHWVSGFGLKLRMSPFNAVVALASLRAFPALRDERARCLTYFRSRLAEIPYLEHVSVPSGDSMGAWYGFKPLYLPEELGVSRATLVRALQAEGVEVDAPSAPPLSTLPLYDDPVALYGGRAPSGRLAPVEHPVAAHVGAHALSLPTFYRWDSDREVIDQYVAAFSKVYEHRHALVEWERSAVGVQPGAAPAALPRDAVGAGR